MRSVGTHLCCDFDVLIVIARQHMNSRHPPPPPTPPPPTPMVSHFLRKRANLIISRHQSVQSVTSTIRCTQCDRTYRREEDILRHYKDSPAHPKCNPCSQGFADEDGYDDVRRDSFTLASSSQTRISTSQKCTRNSRRVLHKRARRRLRLRPGHHNFLSKKYRLSRLQTLRRPLLRPIQMTPRPPPPPIQ